MYTDSKSGTDEEHDEKDELLQQVVNLETLTTVIVNRRLGTKTTHLSVKKQIGFFIFRLVEP